MTLSLPGDAAPAVLLVGTLSRDQLLIVQFWPEGHLLERPSPSYLHLQTVFGYDDAGGLRISLDGIIY